VTLNADKNDQHHGPENEKKSVGTQRSEGKKCGRHVRLSQHAVRMMMGLNGG